MGFILPRISEDRNNKAKERVMLTVEERNDRLDAPKKPARKSLKDMTPKQIKAEGLRLARLFPFQNERLVNMFELEWLIGS